MQVEKQEEETLEKEEDIQLEQHTQNKEMEVEDPQQKELEEQ